MRFPEIMRLRVPTGLSGAVQTAAKRHHTSGPEWARQLILRELKAEGLCLRDDGKLEQLPQAPQGQRPWPA